MRDLPNTIHILHADDELGFANMTSVFLEREDNRFSVETTTSVQEGIKQGYLDTIKVTTDMSRTGLGPTGRAARTGELQAIQNVHEESTFEPWREEALKRGYESSASILITYRETRYGLLNVYADRPHAFDEREIDLLAEVGPTIAHGIYRAKLANQGHIQYSDETGEE